MKELYGKDIDFRLMMFGLFATSVQAQEVCDLTEECQKLKKEAEIHLPELLKSVPPKLTDILTTKVSHLEAKEFCEIRGMRLPTARELAEVSQNLGARGISKTKEVGYSLVKGSESTGKPDYFYFSHEGYEPPEGDLGNKWFWSLSEHPDYLLSVFILDGENGRIRNSDRNNSDDIDAVRCVLSQ